MNYQDLRKKELLENMIEMMLDKHEADLIIKHLKKEHLDKIAETIHAESLNDVIVYTDPHKFMQNCHTYSKPDKHKMNFSIFGDAPLPALSNQPSGNQPPCLSEKEHAAHFNFNTDLLQIVISEVKNFSEYGQDTTLNLLIYLPNERQVNFNKEVEMVLNSVGYL